jgi:hypothetical protein
MRVKTILSKLSRYSLPILLILVIADIALFGSGIISKEQMKYFILVPAILELTFLMILLFNLSRIIARYRTLKKAGEETFAAWQEALEEIFPARVARLILIEPQLYYALYLSLRKKQLPDKTACFATRLASYLFLAKAIIVICWLEILAVFLMLPDRWLVWKVVHLVLGVWAIMWIWADAQAMRLYPHQMTGKGVRFRVGLRYHQEIPWEYIRAVKRIEKPAPGIAPGPDKKNPGSLFLSVGEKCNVEIELNPPQSFQGMLGNRLEVGRVYLSLEKPEDFMLNIPNPALVNQYNA